VLNQLYSRHFVKRLALQLYHSTKVILSSNYITSWFVFGRDISKPCVKNSKSARHSNNQPVWHLRFSQQWKNTSQSSRFLHTEVWQVDSSWNVIAHGDAREGKWWGNWRMAWLASTLHTTSEHGVTSINAADAHTSAASSWLSWRPRRFKWTHPYRWKMKPGFCGYAITFQLTSNCPTIRWTCCLQLQSRSTMRQYIGNCPAACMVSKPTRPQCNIFAKCSCISKRPLPRRKNAAAASANIVTEASHIFIIRPLAMWRCTTVAADCHNRTSFCTSMDLIHQHTTNFIV